MNCVKAILYAVCIVALPAEAWAQLGEATEEEAQLGRPSVATVSDGAPPNPDPRDFSGMWKMAPRPMPSAPPPGAVAAPQPGPPGGGADYRRRSLYCIPGQVLLASVEGGTEILQSDDRITTITEEHHNIRRIYIDQKHTDPLVRSINGDSIAHWDGDALVIETVGMHGYGVSPTLVRTERWTKEEGGAVLVDEVTYADPSGQETPRNQTARFVWMPGTQVLEYICEDESSEFMSEDY